MIVIDRQDERGELVARLSIDAIAAHDDGEVLWVVTPHRCIVANYLIARGGRWIDKQVGEAEFPSSLRCPLAFFALATEGVNEGWRAAVCAAESELN